MTGKMNPFNPFNIRVIPLNPVATPLAQRQRNLGRAMARLDEGIGMTDEDAFHVARNLRAGGRRAAARAMEERDEGIFEQ